MRCEKPTLVEVQDTEQLDVIHVVMTAESVWNPSDPIYTIVNIASKIRSRHSIVAFLPDILPSVPPFSEKLPLSDSVVNSICP